MLEAFAAAPWLTRERVFGYARLLVAVYLIVAIGYLLMSPGMIDPKGKPVGTDFMNVWAAGKLALSGEPGAAYDYGRHYAVQRSALAWPAGTEVPYFGWHYPPFFLIAAAGLALLPYGAALALWMAVTLPAYLAAMISIVGDRRAWLFAIAFPGTFINLGHGQNGFLSAGLLGGGLLLLDRAPLRAGVLLGLLAYKPQFGLLIPLALLAGSHWRAIGAAAATALCLVLVSLICYGRPVWTAFAESLAPTRSFVLEQGATGWEKIQSVFSAIRMLGGGIPEAYAGQVAVTILAGVAVWHLWRGAAPSVMKSAGLVVASLLATPYVLDYDLMLLALPIAWLAVAARDGGFLRWEGSVLALAVCLPLISRVVGGLVCVPLGPPTLLLLLGMILRRARHRSSPNPLGIAAPALRSWQS